MPLDVRLDSDPEGLRAAAHWMSRLARGASEAGEALNAVRRDAERGWEGPAGAGFTRHTVTFRDGADAMHEGGDVVARGLARHADDLLEVRRLLDDARRVAQAAGLSTSDAEIADPGPAPPQPGVLPPGATTDQVDAQNLAVQAASAHQTRTLAFQDAQQTVAVARAAQQQSQNTLIELLGGSPVKMGLQVLDTGSGLLGSAAGATLKYRHAAKQFANEAAGRAAAGLDRSLPPNQRARALLEKNILAAKSATAQARATSTPIRRGIDQIPERWRSKVIDPKLALPGQIGKFSRPVLSKIPAVGLVATGAGVWYDIETGKDPTRAIVSGGGAFVTGMVVGAAIGGPVGVVVGAVVGMGVGYAIDHWDDDLPAPTVLAPGRGDGASGATPPA